MQVSQSDFDDTLRRRSGWLIPIGVFAVTAVLSAVVLMYYLAPTPASFIEERPSPTSRTDPISLSVNGTRLTIPANYIIYKNSRQGGPKQDIALITTFPDFRGYSDWESRTFSDNGANSDAIFLLIREDPLNFSEAERLRRIYLNLVTNPRGEPGPSGLTEYVFRDDSGYRDEDLFVGGRPDRPIILRCDRLSQQVRSPSCLRDMMLKRGVAISYRFKRAHLAEWREIADGIDGLVQSFRRHWR